MVFLVLQELHKLVEQVVHQVVQVHQVQLVAQVMLVLQD